jgi:hypothetical protein
VKKLGALCLAALLGCSSGTAHMKSDWERQNEGRLARDESDAPAADRLPAFPRNENLTEFTVSPPSGFRFFVDRTSISVGKDRIVRFVLVARSPSGVDNISYEGINCREREYRIYAVGRADGSWVSRPGEWRAIAQSPQPGQGTLQREYFCPGGIATADASDAVKALQRGGHPWARPEDSAPSGGGR